MSDNPNRDQVPDARTRLNEALQVLVEADDRWRVVPSPGCLTVTRGWPDGSVDVLVILSPETAFGRREGADQRRAWATKGTLDEVTAAARDLPGPFAPGAPNGPASCGPTGFWP